MHGFFGGIDEAHFYLCNHPHSNRQTTPITNHHGCVVIVTVELEYAGAPALAAILRAQAAVAANDSAELIKQLTIISKTIQVIIIHHILDCHVLMAPTLC
jgi:hypothetical protein